MPVYNAAPFLVECLQSVLKQTEPDWELLAVDDFSTDQSWAILQEFAQQDDRIKVFTNEEKGIIPALRKAYAASSGNLITRMDADDVMPPRKLEVLCNALKKVGPGHIATGLVQYFSEGKLGEGFQKYEQWLNALTGENRNFEAIYKECVIPSPAWMVYRDDLDQCEAFNPDTYPEDYDLCFRFYKNRLKPVGCREVVHLWRDHQQRASRNDPNYTDQTFFELKLPYFIDLDYNQSRPLVLWGAGKKGKTLAKMLAEKYIDFRWVCNSTSKWGKQINGIKMENFNILQELVDPQVIIAVAGPKDQKGIEQYLKKMNFTEGKHYYFFC